MSLYVVTGYVIPGYVVGDVGDENLTIQLPSHSVWRDLITSEHIDKPKFMSMVDSTLSPFSDLFNSLVHIPFDYSLDTAIGSQLDVIGRWVGVTRDLTTQIPNVYFSLNTTNGTGFDQGVWLGPYDSASGLSTLPDEEYRLIIRAKILNNHWDGTKDSAYVLGNVLFSTVGYTLFIEDFSDLSIRFGIIGADPPSALIYALFTQGKFNTKPATVQVQGYMTQSVSGPLFGFDVMNTSFAGFNVGGWAILTTL